MVLYDVKYDGRDIFHRLSLSDMWVGRIETGLIDLGPCHTVTPELRESVLTPADLS